VAQKMYVDVNEIMKDWGCSRAKGYQIIADLNAQLEEYLEMKNKNVKTEDIIKEQTKRVSMRKR